MYGNKKMNLKRFFAKPILFGTSLILAQLAAGIAHAQDAAETNQRKRQFGEPFQSVFPFSGLGSQWWIAQYDHPANWFQTAWRKSSVDLGAAGIAFSLTATDQDNIVEASVLKEDDGTLIGEGMTTKAFTSGQMQRNKWYGYGRYEVIMQPASGDGLITAFYLYTGPYFGDTHEEVDIEFLGRNPNKIHLNRYRDGQPLEDPIWMDLGFDSTERPRLYAFEWNEDSLVWYAGETELFRISDPDEVPVPPAKIYLDLWAGGTGQADWAGQATETSAGNALVQCASYTPPSQDTPQCSDLMNDE